MSKSILKMVKPLSSDMEEKLMEIHERDLLSMEPSPQCMNITSVSLLRRKLVGVKQYTIRSKTFHDFYITPLGIYYLSVKCKI